MTAPDPRLGEIEARLEAATPGPWVDRVDDLTDDVDVVHDQEHVSFVASCGDKCQPRAYADAEFIAAAPADVAYLLAELRKAQDALGRVEWLAKQYDHEADRLTTKAENFVPGEVRSRYLGYAADTRMKASLIRAAVAAAGGGSDAQV